MIVIDQILVQQVCHVRVIYSIMIYCMDVSWLQGSGTSFHPVGLQIHCGYSYGLPLLASYLKLLQGELGLPTQHSCGRAESWLWSWSLGLKIKMCHVCVIFYRYWHWNCSEWCYVAGMMSISQSTDHFQCLFFAENHTQHGNNRRYAESQDELQPSRTAHTGCAAAL